MKINDLLHTGNIDINTVTSKIRQNMYDTKFLWLIGLIFELRIDPIFQYA